MAITSSASQESISDDFLHIASEAVRNAQSSEGALRSAISRAYYSVFLTARDKLFGSDQIQLTNTIRKQLSKKFKKSKQKEPGSHDIIIFAITEIKQTSTIKPISFSQQISQLKEARIHADYHFSTTNLARIPYSTWQEYAKENIELASQLLPIARRLPSF